MDVTIFAQEPKLGPVKGGDPRQRWPSCSSVPRDAVNVKAKTGEKVGHIGRGEAIGCQAVVLIERQTNHRVTETQRKHESLKSNDFVSVSVSL